MSAGHCQSREPLHGSWTPAPTQTSVPRIAQHHIDSISLNKLQRTFPWRLSHMVLCGAAGWADCISTFQRRGSLTCPLNRCHYVGGSLEILLSKHCTATRNEWSLNQATGKRFTCLHRVSVIKGSVQQIGKYAYELLCIKLDVRM